MRGDSGFMWPGGEAYPIQEKLIDVKVSVKDTIRFMLPDGPLEITAERFESKTFLLPVEKKRF